MMQKLLARMKKKVGPFPLYVWAGVAGAAGWLLLRRNAAPASVAASDGSLPDTSAYGYGPDAGSDGAGGGASPADDTLPPHGEAFPDKGITSDFQDFMNQLYDNWNSEHGGGTSTDAGGGEDSNGTETTNPSDGDKDTGKPKGKKVPTKKVAKKGPRRPRVKKAKKPAPRAVAASARRNRSAPQHGSGRAGARPRGRARPAAPRARPRQTVKRPPVRKPPKPKNPRRRILPRRNPGQRAGGRPK